MLYRTSVFVNFPMDVEYKPMLDAMLFAIYGCGFVARLAIETSGGREQRLDRIVRLIADCRLSIHDMSRVQLSDGLPRFNMPFECGIAYAAMKLTLPPDRDTNPQP